MSDINDQLTLDCWNLFKSVPKLSTLEAPTPKWLWPDLLVDGGYHIISGEPGSMKSYLTLQLALGISQGKLFDCEVPSRPVIYIDRENPLNLIKERALNIGLGNEENFCYWGLWNVNPPPPIGHEVYLTLAKGLKPIMVFDSLIRFHDRDEDKSDAMKLVSEHFRALTTAGATVIVLHHKGKPSFNGPSSPYRGSSEIAGSGDVCFSVTKKEENNSLNLWLKSFKFRWGEDREVGFVFDKELKRFKAMEAPATGTDEEKVRAAITAYPGQRLNQLSLVTGMNEHKIRAILKQWLGILWVEQPGPHKAVQYYPVVDSKGDINPRDAEGRC